jgi:hypothetical protein
MPAHSVKLILEDGRVIYVSPSRARQLLKYRVAAIASERPFAVRMRAGAELESEKCTVQRWTGVSGRMLMNGSLLERKPPRP